ncbi:MAG: hypothetical protein ACYDH5_17640 [Acidimicrobiales bacterium]
MEMSLATLAAMTILAFTTGASAYGVAPESVSPARFFHTTARTSVSIVSDATPNASAALTDVSAKPVDMPSGPMRVGIRELGSSPLSARPRGVSPAISQSTYVGCPGDAVVTIDNLIGATVTFKVTFATPTGDFETGYTLPQAVQDFSTASFLILSPAGYGVDDVEAIFSGDGSIISTQCAGNNIA